MSNIDLAFSRKSYELLAEDESSEFLDITQPSVLLPRLLENEKYFFELIETGDVNAVREFLEANVNFNINCVDFQGMTAMHIAVKMNSLPMVKFLLANRSGIADCTLHAIKANLIPILEELLNHMDTGQEFLGCTNSPDFPDYITPLILAAQCGHYEIIELLIARGHSIPELHKPNCVCQECLDNDDLLHVQTRRLSIYKAIMNPAYICHSTNDPILTVFLLSEELRQNSFIEREFRNIYMELSEEVAQFAVDLIGYCRSSQEMELILKQPKGLKILNFMYPRLILAMDYKQKKFVSHPHTQKILESAWLGDWTAWKSYPESLKYFFVVVRIFLLPVIAIMLIVVPKNNLVKRWSSPISKAISHTASYLLFLFLIFWQSNLDKSTLRRGMPNSGLEPVLIAFTIGYAWNAIRMSATQGIYRHLLKLWTWYDFVMISLFVHTYLFWLSAYIDVKENDDEDLERKYWHYLDPTLIAEGLFAFGTIMAFFRLTYLFQINYHLGPLQISLGKMSADIAKYLTIFIVIMLSFSAGLCKLYQYYDGMVQMDLVSQIKTSQQSSFISWPSTLKTLFWALLCMSPLESADVVIENLPGELGDKSMINKHNFTENVGYIAFGCYEVLCVIIILNMLIATMSNTFQKVTDNVIVEWTFGRTNVYIEFIMQSVLPTPLNLIPTPQSIMQGIEWMSLRFKPTLEEKSKISLNHCCYIQREPDRQLEQDYPILMAQLVQRYFRVTELESENEMEALHQEIQELKNLINEKQRSSVTLI